MFGRRSLDIVPYTGYGNKNRIYCYGRILRKTTLQKYSKPGRWYNLLNTFHRMLTDEVPRCAFEYSIENYVNAGITNSEGYYRISEEVPVDPGKQPVTIVIKLAKENSGRRHHDGAELAVNGKILFPKPGATFGVISDIDDTVLKTDVMSRFRWKMLYNTAFLSSKDRKEITGTSGWYQGLHNLKNPFFYISNSPWNIYDYLFQFLSDNKFPEGPILLRDFGSKVYDALQDYENHKINEVESIITMYPELPFVLIGDGAERDADIYTAIATKFPSRVKAIFIRRMGNAKYQARIERLINTRKDYFFFIKDAAEAIQCCQGLGLLGL